MPHAIFTILVYKAGNRYQAAIKAASEAQIAKVKSDAETESKRIEEDGRKAIAKVKSDAETESKRIEEEGNKAIARVEADSRERIAQAKSDADIKIAETKERTAQLEREAAQLREQNEQEQTKRLELEKSLGPRMLPLIWRRGVPNFAPLQQFSGMTAIFEVLPDVEANRAAAEIGAVLRAAGWKIGERSLNPELNQGVFDGVHIQWCRAQTEPTVMTPDSFNDPDELRCTAAARTLAEFLASNRWERIWPHPDPKSAKLPTNTIRIRVGFKPSSYFEKLREQEFRNEAGAPVTDVPPDR